MKTIVYGDGSLKKHLQHRVFFASALSGRNQQPPAMRVAVDFKKHSQLLTVTG
jgi:hypothetical protein